MKYMNDERINSSLNFAELNKVLLLEIAFQLAELNKTLKNKSKREVK